MDQKTCSSIVIVPAATGTDTPDKSQPQPPAEQQALLLLLHYATQLVLLCSRVATLALVTYSFAATAWRARRDPGDLAFVAGAYAALAALLLCLRRAEGLAPDSPGGAAEMRRLHVAVWVLSAALSCAFAYRVSLLVPAALVVVIWCMTSFVLLVGFYLLVVLRTDQRYHGFDRVDCGCDTGAGDGKPLVKTIRPSHELV